MFLKLKYALYSFAVIFFSALMTSYFVRSGLEGFYASLDKPLQTPSNLYFRYVWGGIYLLLFSGFYIALNVKKTTEQTLDLNALFLMQLFLQILWAFCFFYMYQIGLSALIIVLLVMVSALLMHSLFFISRWSFLLFMPYFLWLLFATYLNIFLIFLN